ncbi:hypothetical protein EV715DRAFT_278233 [Schizophyllum commune]
MAARDPRPTLEGVYLRNGEEATLVLHATQVGILHMVRHRLDQRGRDAIKAGNIYVWEEQTQQSRGETCLERWTDGMRWGPSRGGADGFLKYNQKLEEGESGPPLIKRTYSALMRVGAVEAPRKYYIVAYSSTCADIDARLLRVEGVSHLPLGVPPGWYQPWRAPRQRGKKTQDVKAKKTGPSASPGRLSAAMTAQRDVHLTLPPAAYPRHPYTSSQHVYSPGAPQNYQATSASSSSEASATSRAPPSDAPVLPVYANAAPPVAAPQPIHPGPRPMPRVGDQRRAMLPRNGDSAVADEGGGMSMADPDSATNQSLQQFADSSRSSYASQYTPWGASFDNTADRPQHAYDMQPYEAQRDRPQMYGYGLAAMQACVDIPEVPAYPHQAGYHDHLGVALTRRTTRTRYTPYGAPEKYAHPSPLLETAFYPWKTDTPGHSCSWPAEAVYQNHSNDFPYLADGHNGWKSTHYPEGSHFAFTGSTHTTTN